MTSTAVRTTHSTCYMCTSNCPITVESEGDHILSITHPACVRAEAMQEQRDHASRHVDARVRKTADDAWRTMDRRLAVEHVAKRLQAIRDAHGADAVVFAAGYTKEARPYLQRLANVFGSPHYVTESSCCFASGSVAAKITLGAEYGYFLGPSRGHFAETKCRLVWSNNPAASQIPYDRHHLLADAERVPTVVVDPRRTSLARAATVHLQPRPGTDGALALGLAHVIVRDGLHDERFVQHHAHGFEAYREYIATFTPEHASAITGVPAERIERAARLYGEARPAQLTISPNATTHHSNGFQAHRAILLLPALCGNLDVPGGNRPWGDRLTERSITLHGERENGPTMGSERFPVFTEHYPEGQGMVLADAIESGAVKAVVSIGMNVMMWPNSQRLATALRSLDLFVTCDFFDNPTVDLATVSMPAATHLEREALITWGKGRVQRRPAAVPPRGQARGDTEFLFELAHGLGHGRSFWNGSIHDSFEERLASTDLRFADLPEDGRPRKLSPERDGSRHYEREGFGTPTGKVEFESTVLADHGHPPLPVFQEPYWSPVRTPDVARDYPLVLTTGGRSNTYTHSQGRQFETLRAREPEPYAQIHPDDARARGIGQDDGITISSPLGTVRMRAHVCDDVAPGVVHAPHGWAVANVNTLIPDAGLDPISGFPPFKSSLCQVARSPGT